MKKWSWILIFIAFKAAHSFERNSRIERESEARAVAEAAATEALCKTAGDQRDCREVVNKYRSRCRSSLNFGQEAFENCVFDAIDADET